jgi:hypothetical protein
MIAAACGSSPASPPPPPVAVATPIASPSAGAAASPDGSAPAGPSDDPGATAAAPTVSFDEALLRFLPPDIGGVMVVAEPDAFAQAAADPDFARNVEAAAFAVAVDGDDLASGVVAQLRPGVYDEALFRDWRDTYNEGACGQAGGVAGNAQAELGGRTVYIATCAGGLRVYHAYLPERDVIVSLFSLGDRRFGEQLMGGLRP